MALKTAKNHALAVIEEQSKNMAVDIYGGAEVGRRALADLNPEELHKIEEQWIMVAHIQA